MPRVLQIINIGSILVNDGGTASIQPDIIFYKLLKGEMKMSEYGMDVVISFGGDATKAEMKKIVGALSMCVEQGYHEQWDETMKKDFDLLIAVHQSLKDELQKC